MKTAFLVVLGLLAAAPALAGYGGPEKASAPLVFTGWRTHVCAPLGVAFDVPDDPAAPVALAERSYPYAERGTQFEFEVDIASGRVRIWGFHDDEGRTVGDWFKGHFGFLVDERALVWTQALGAAAAGRDVPAVVVHQPKSPQVPARETTVTRIGAWTLVVTCEAVDAEDGRRLCDGVVDTLRSADDAADGEECTP